MKLVYGSYSVENLIDTACDDLIDIYHNDDCYMAARMLQAAKGFWEQLEFYKARKWITEEDALLLWERYENALSEYIEDWDAPEDEDEE